MAKTTLRAYTQEIELMVNQNRTDEAIVHCKHILNLFPKHVDSYRMLGKAFLEANRYADATDIFQRVLSSVPDDFVAHLGMSIIKEDEGNLDAALWHMERAYENQPFNSAILEELKRLFERRDGVAPMKIRLTRGALAKMYAKGDLYQQAIAELRIELGKDPDRFDLQVLLARMFFSSGKKVEAAEISSQILKKLPYCLDANRILSRVLQASDRLDDALTIQKRVAALDPYEAFVSPDAPTVDRINDAAVTLERLDLQPTDIATIGKSSSEWMSSLGIQAVEMEDVDSELPDWLVKASEASEGSAPEAPFMPEQTSLAETQETVEDTDWIGALDAPLTDEPIDDEEIPEWMKISGWKVSTGEAEKTESEFAEEENLAETNDSDLSPAEIPDWLKSIAPEDGLAEGEEEDQELASLFNIPEEPVYSEQTDIPAWMETVTEEQGNQGFDSDVEFFSEPAEAEPELFGSELDFAVDENENQAVDIDGSSPETEDLPEWLRNLGTFESEAAQELSEETLQAETENLPDWLKEFEEKTEQAAGLDQIQESLPSLDSFLETSTAIPVPDLEKDGTGWVTEFEAEQDLAESLPVGEDFLAETEPEEPFSDIVFSEIEEETPAVAPAKAEIPDWFVEIIDQPEDEQAPADAPSMEHGAEVEPILEDSLQSGIQADIADIFTPGETFEAEINTNISDMVTHSLGHAEAEISAEKDVYESPELEEASLPGEEVMPTEVELESPPDFEDMDAAIAWLEKLAASQKISDEVPESIETIDDGTSSDVIEVLVEAWAPESVESLLETRLFTPEAGEPESETEAQETELLEIDGLQGVIDGAAPEAAATEEIELESPPDFEDMDAAMAWLEGLAAKHGVPEEQPAPEAEHAPEIQPEWILESKVEFEEITEPETEIESAAEDAWPVPDWLQEELEPAAPEAVILDELPEISLSELSEAVVPEELFVPQVETPEILPADIEAEVGEPEQPTLTSDQAPGPVGGAVKKPTRILEFARQESSSGNLDSALAKYQQLIQEEQLVYEVVFDLRQMLNDHPENFELWQTLGDAYMHNGQLQEALEAYARAEELL